jgi:hypothetical protein
MQLPARMKITLRFLPILLLTSLSSWAAPPEYGCTFANGTCVSHISPCGDSSGRQCQNRLVVDCAGSTLYDGDFVIQATEGQTLFQGVTTVRFPAPPAVTIQPGDEAVPRSGGKDRLDAHLYSVTGVTSGSCRLAQ